MVDRADDLRRISSALEEARAIAERFTPGEVEHRRKAGGDPVTEADLAINEALLRRLPQRGEGWLSEETADDPARLDCSRVWIVDPLDGTKEFVQGIPEWCISIGLVEDGRPVAGGICSPTANRTIVGAIGCGVTCNGKPCAASDRADLEGAQVLASRSEVGRGEWQRFDDAPFLVKPMGSVAYKMGLVAAGFSDVTWTLVPKHEWDVAGGAALVLAAGGQVWLPDGSEPSFNLAKPLFPGMLAAPSGLADSIREYLR